MASAPALRKLVRVPQIATTRLLGALFFAASLVIPRSKRIWAFGSWYGEQFAGNPKHFFLYCSTLANSPIQPVWISRNAAIVKCVRQLGLRAHHRLSPLGLWYRLRAKVYLIDCRVMDIGPIAGSGATVVNLWHGVPLKKIEQDIEQLDHPIVRARRGSLLTRIMLRVRHPQLTERYDFVLATSTETAPRFASAFGVPQDRVIVAGYPRNDPMLARDDMQRFLLPQERQVIEELRQHIREGRRVLLYMPTFRDWNNSADRTVPVDWGALNETLHAATGVLYCKMHPADQAGMPVVNHLPHVRILPASLDVYPILKYTDALITDYSSIFFDYLLLDKPIVFYPYDLADYQRLSRTLYDPYEQVTPGPKVYTEEGFRQFVTQLLSAYPAMAAEWCEPRARVRKWAHGFADDRAAERLQTVLYEKLAG